MTRRMLLVSVVNALQHSDGQQAERLLKNAAAQSKPRAGPLHVEKKNFRHEHSFGDCSFSSRFRIASITKPVMDAALMSLVDQDKLNLEDAVSTYLPQVPPPDKGAPSPNRQQTI